MSCKVAQKKTRLESKYVTPKKREMGKPGPQPAGPSFVVGEEWIPMPHCDFVWFFFLLKHTKWGKKKNNIERGNRKRVAVSHLPARLESFQAHTFGFKDLGKNKLNCRWENFFGSKIFF